MCLQLYILYFLFQANGLDERWNQTLQNMLAKLVQSNQSSWSSYLDTCVFAYNTSKQESTKHTPFEIMFNRQATLPIDVELNKTSPENSVHTFSQMQEPDQSGLELKRSFLLNDVKRNIIKAQEKQKIVYEAKHTMSAKLKLGDTVLKKDQTRKKRKGGKLDFRFKGPFKVTKILPRGAYELKSENGSLSRACGAHLKVYHPSNPGTMALTEPSIKNCSTSDDSTSEFDLHPKLDDQSQSDTSVQSILLSLLESSENTYPPTTSEDKKIALASTSINTKPVLSDLETKSDSSPVTPVKTRPTELLSSPPTSLVLMTKHCSAPPATSSSSVITTNPFSVATTSPAPATASRVLTTKPSSTAPTCTCRTKCHAKKSCPCRRANQLCSELCHPTRKCTNYSKSKHQENIESINIDNYSPANIQPASDSVWKNVCGIRVLHSHQEFLQSQEWLDDVLINVGQKMLKSQFSAMNGLQNCLLVGAMSAEVPAGEFIQVILIGGNHWIAVSTVGCKPGHVLVYDSLHYRFSSHTHTIVADLLQTRSKQLTFDFVNVQYQSGANDCGLFALAFCTSIYVFLKNQKMFFTIRQKCVLIS